MEPPERCGDSSDSPFSSGPFSRRPNLSLLKLFPSLGAFVKLCGSTPKRTFAGAGHLTDGQLFDLFSLRPRGRTTMAKFLLPFWSFWVFCARLACLSINTPCDLRTWPLELEMELSSASSCKVPSVRLPFSADYILKDRISGKRR